MTENTDHGSAPAAASESAAAQDDAHTSVAGTAPSTAQEQADGTGQADGRGQADGTGQADGRRRGRTLYLVRHGQTTSNVIRALDTNLPGAELTSLGRQQAAETGRKLAEALGHARGDAAVDSAHAGGAVGNARGNTAVPGVDEDAAAGRTRVYMAASEALRAQQTAQGIAEVLPDGTVATREVLPGISEIPAGELEMKTDRVAHAEYHVAFGAWLMGDMDRPVRGALNGTQVLERFLPSLFGFMERCIRSEDAEAVSAPGDFVVVSHSAVIRFVAAFLGNLDPEFAFATLLPNAQWVKVELPTDQELLDLAKRARTVGDYADDAGEDGGASGLGKLFSDFTVATDVLEQVSPVELDTFRGCLNVTHWGDDVPTLRTPTV